MAEFTLSSQKAKNPGKTGGIQPSLLSGNAGANVRAPSIDPRSASVTFTPAKIPTAVKNQTSEGIQHFMGVTAEAAFRFQDRESTYFANKSILKTEAEIDIIMNGYVDENGVPVKGYLSSKGDNANTLFNPLQEKLNSVVQNNLADLEPSVREKAVFRSMDAKNVANKIASKHRMQQYEIAEEAVKAEQVKQLTALAAKDYRRLFTPDSFGKTIKDRIYKDIYQDPAKANKAWYGLLTGSLEMIVNQAPTIQGGLDVANDIFNKHIAKELSGDLDALNSASSFLRSTDMVNQRFQWSKEDRARLEKERIESAIHKKNEMGVVGLFNDGTIIEAEDLYTAWISGDISDGFYKSYTNEHHRGLYNHNHDYYLELVDNIVKGEDVSYKEIAQSTRLAFQYKSSVLALAEAAETDLNFRGRMDRYLELGRAAINRGSDLEIFGDDRKVNLENDLIKNLGVWIRAGKTESEIDKLIESKYSFTAMTRGQMARINIPGTTNSVEPGTHEELNEYARIVTATPTTGDGFKISEEEKTLFFEQTEKWHKILESEGVPRDPKEAATKQVEEQLNQLEDQKEIDDKELSDEDKTYLQSITANMTDEQKGPIVRNFIQQRDSLRRRTEQKRIEQLDKRKEAIMSLAKDGDIEEALALANSDASNELEQAIFLTNYRKDRLANINSALILSRTRLRRLKKEDASEEEIALMEESIAETESIFNNEKARQKAAKAAALREAFQND